MKHTDASGASHGTVKSYLIGFVLSVILTAIPFWMVMTGAAAPSTLAITISLFAVVQIVVHLVYFLHMNTKSEGGWNLIALIFTGLIIAIVVVGSLWIMYNLNVNMMAH
ncbi:Cytochrome o ubiquinol oxidase protein CyoD [Leminorella richardii]|uniref:Cytochrome bo(3) ubiquinol oxidase subunit 4 n=1 Tax=Leminorella richardii TaxID=158841 RepID=A0A2X4VDK7_9GAMM|nr:cytochrome o ubiquinol oxidase subunit IV [Leminorella richardii]SQI43350.1 Cytochrome o ubiquinol oxidase protein CyoD [Leminorella richardii]